MISSNYRTDVGLFRVSEEPGGRTAEPTVRTYSSSLMSSKDKQRKVKNADQSQPESTQTSVGGLLQRQELLETIRSLLLQLLASANSIATLQLKVLSSILSLFEEFIYPRSTIRFPYIKTVE